MRVDHDPRGVGPRQTPGVLEKPVTARRRTDRAYAATAWSREVARPRGRCRGARADVRLGRRGALRVTAGRGGRSCLSMTSGSTSARPPRSGAGRTGRRSRHQRRAGPGADP